MSSRTISYYSLIVALIILVRLLFAVFIEQDATFIGSFIALAFIAVLLQCAAYYRRQHMTFEQTINELNEKTPNP